MARPEADVSGRRISPEKLFETFTELRGLLAKLVLGAERDAYSIAQFCERHGISVQFYYTLTEEERPAEMRLRTRVLISKEDAAAWRVARVAASKAKAEA